jgi:hypothetical protein
VPATNDPVLDSVVYTVGMHIRGANRIPRRIACEPIP